MTNKPFRAAFIGLTGIVSAPVGTGLGGGRSVQPYSHAAAVDRLPLDVDLVLRLAREHEVLITVEEGSIGGFGSYVLQTLAEHGVLDSGLKVRSMVLPDIFIDQDSPSAMYTKAGLDSAGIVAKVFDALGRDVRTETAKLG